MPHPLAVALSTISPQESGTVGEYKIGFLRGDKLLNLNGGTIGWRRPIKKAAGSLKPKQEIPNFHTLNTTYLTTSIVAHRLRLEGKMQQMQASGKSSPSLYSLVQLLGLVKINLMDRKFAMRIEKSYDLTPRLPPPPHLILPAPRRRGSKERECTRQDRWGCEVSRRKLRRRMF